MINLLDFLFYIEYIGLLFVFYFENLAMPWRLDSMNPEFLRKNKEVFADKFSSDELFSVLYRLFTPLQLLCMKKEILERSLAISEILCFKTGKADENIKNDYCSLNNEEWLRKYLRNANSYYE